MILHPMILQMSFFIHKAIFAEISLSILMCLFQNILICIAFQRRKICCLAPSLKFLIFRICADLKVLNILQKALKKRWVYPLKVIEKVNTVQKNSKITTTPFNLFVVK